MNRRETDHLAVFSEPDVSELGFRRLAEFRHRIREFLHYSEEESRAEGIEPQQHQLLLTLKGLPKEIRPTVSTLAGWLCLRHNSTVELIDRLVERGAVRRKHACGDHREVLVELTPSGEALLHRLAGLHWKELRVSGPALSQSLCAVMRRAPGEQERAR
jgi:DNA-binding MarR family transcriptional regulator